MDEWYIYIVYFVASLIFVSSILNIIQRCLMPICCASAENPYRNTQSQQQEQSVRVSIVEPPPYTPASAPDIYSIEDLPPPPYEDAIKMPVAGQYKL